MLRDELDIDATELAVDPGDRLTEAGLNVMVAPVGEEDADRVTVPWKLFILVSWIVDDPC